MSTNSCYLNLLHLKERITLRLSWLQNSLFWTITLECIFNTIVAEEQTTVSNVYIFTVQQVWLRKVECKLVKCMRNLLKISRDGVQHLKAVDNAIWAHANGNLINALVFRQTNFTRAIYCFCRALLVCNRILSSDFFFKPFFNCSLLPTNFVNYWKIKKINIIWRK